MSNLNNYRISENKSVLILILSMDEMLCGVLLESSCIVVYVECLSRLDVPFGEEQQPDSTVEYESQGFDILDVSPSSVFVVYS